MNVVLVAPLPPPRGGIATWAQMVAAEAGTRADILLEVFDIAPRWRGVHDLRPWVRLVGGTAQGIRDMAKFSATVARKRPIAIHICSAGQYGLARDVCMLIVGRIARCVSIYHVRNGRITAAAAAGNSEWGIFRLVVALADFTIALDCRTHQTVRQNLPHVRVVQIPNCIDLSTVPAPTRVSGRTAGPIVLFVGWVKEEKGIVDLVDACCSLAARVEFELHILGPIDPAIAANLNQLAHSLGPRAQLHGEVDHRATLEMMARADLFVLPSYSEGSPNVIIEAMACSLPIVATNVGTIPEMIQDKSKPCGVCVHPGDVAALEAGIERLLRDAKLRQRLGGNGRKLVAEKYALAQAFDRYAALWQTGLAR